MPSKKIVVVGDGACGKTCLLVTFTKGKFPEEYVPTVMDNFYRDIKVNNETISLIISDTAGQEEYDRLRVLSYVESDLVVICFSIERPDTLQNVASVWAPEVRKNLGSVPIVLVGNKHDLRHDPETIAYLAKHNQEPVSYQTARKVAKSIKAVEYIECSSKRKYNVDEVFTTAARILMTKNIKKCIIL